MFLHHNTMDRLIVAGCFLFALIGISSVQGQHGCQEVRTLTFSSGVDRATIASDNFDAGGNYLPYTWCRWIITVPENRRIKISVNGTFDVEVGQNGACNDFVNVHEFPANSMSYKPDEATLNDPANVAAACRGIGLVAIPVAGPVCGNHLPDQHGGVFYSYSSRTNQVIVEFCTDYAIQGRGWKADLEFTDVPVPGPSDPCDFEVNLLTLTDTYEIKSPRFPGAYPPNQRCTWTVNTNPAYPVLVDPRYFDLDRWCFDVLTISEIARNFTGRYCSEMPLTSAIRFENTSKLVFTFTSDEVQEGQGFDIALSLIPCKAGYQACDNPTTGCVSVAEQCDGVMHCTDGSDEKHEYCYPDCGVPHFPLHVENARIIGGIEANPYSIPWQVAMMRQSGSQFCGGTIISDRWILTAAHCFTGGPSSAPQFKGRVGGHDVDLSATDDLATDHDFETILCHPYYGTVPGISDYDYCMIKTKEAIKFRKNVVPACLPRQGQEIAPDTMCLTSGWGRSSGGWTPPDSMKDERQDPITIQAVATGKPLQQVLVPVVNRTVCTEMHATVGQRVSERMICSGFLGVGGKNTCHGDSGGPFACKNQYNKYMVAGVVSWGPPTCAHIDFPAVYSNTAYALNWIYDTMANN